jgi:glycerate dehydrogenase
MKIVILDSRPLTEDQAAWEPLKAVADVEVYDQSSEQQARVRARDAAVIITNRVPVTADLIEQAPELRLIAVSFTGYDLVDVVAAQRKNIVVANVPEYGTNSVAQFVFALLLELCHHVGLHAEAVRAGEWTRSTSFSFWKTPLIELAGKTMASSAWAASAGTLVSWPTPLAWR